MCNTASVPKGLMRNLIYQTKLFRRQTKNHKKTTSNVIANIETDLDLFRNLPLIKGFELLRGRHCYRKRRDPFRITGVLDYITVDSIEYPVLCLMELLLAHDANDKLLLKDPAIYSAKNYIPLLETEKEDIKKSIQDKIDKIPPQTQKPDPSPKLLNWGWNWDYPTDEPILYESKKWIESSVHYANDLSILYESVSSVAEKLVTGNIDSITLAEKPEKMEFGSLIIWYNLFDLNESNEFDSTFPSCLFLHDLANSDKINVQKIEDIDRNTNAMWSKMRERLIRSGGDSESVRDILSQEARKAYPYIIMASKESWQNLEFSRLTKNPESGKIELALSSEEVNILRGLMNSKKVPAFIEGHAGSGKTTILLYYIAEVLAQSGKKKSLDELSDHCPAFVTQSEGLLREAKEVARQLLDCRKEIYQRRGSSASNYSSDIGDNFIRFFELCTKNMIYEKQKRYPSMERKSGCIRAWRFKNLLLKSPREISKICYQGTLSKHLTPEVVWFVIRSYIKGGKVCSENPWMTPDEYRDLPEPDRSVPDDIFEQVYETVWEKWYKNLTTHALDNPGKNDFWDLQDVARDLIYFKKNNSAEFSMIVCDESQDFTRLELAALLKFLPYSRYDLRKSVQHRMFHLPLVLAGDPFQTINPSGFRWEIVKSSLHKELSSTFLTYNELPVYHEVLKTNYRNVMVIAKLANALNLARKLIFGCTSSPQKIHDDSESMFELQYFILGETITMDQIINSGIPVIIPYDDKDDAPEFKQLTALKFESNGIEHPIWTPSTIKGLENQRFVALGFGDYFADIFKTEVWDWRKAYDDESLPVSKVFSFEYYMNRLYVAVTRAQKQLFIIDSRKGYETLWKLLETKISNWIEEIRTPDKNEWKKLSEIHLVSGTDPEQLAETDPSGIAERIEERASREQNGEEYRKAAFYYQRAGKEIKRHSCIAWALYFEGEYTQAAKKMREDAKEPEKAREFLWEAGQWRELIEFETPMHKSATWEDRINLAKILVKINKNLNDLKTLLSLYELFVHNRMKILSAWGKDRNPWQLAIGIFGTSIRKLSDLLTGEYFEKFARLLLEMDKCYLIDHDLLAWLYFWSENYSEAAQRWESMNKTHREYFFSKAMSTADYYEKLVYFDSASMPEKVVDTFESNGADWIRLADRDQQRRIARCYAHLGKYRRAAVYFATFEPRQSVDYWIKGLSETNTQSLSADIKEIAQLIKDMFATHNEQENAGLRISETLTQMGRYFYLENKPEESFICFVESKNARLVIQEIMNAMKEKSRPTRTRSIKWDYSFIDKLLKFCNVRVKASFDIDCSEDARDYTALILEIVWEKLHPRHAAAAKRKGKEPENDVYSRKANNYPVSKQLPRYSLRFNNAPQEQRQDFVKIAIQTVTSGHTGWIQKYEGEKKWENICSLVQGLSEMILTDVRLIRYDYDRYSSLVSENWSIDVSNEGDLFILGRFTEESVFRRHCVEYYECLSELKGKSAEFYKKISRLLEHSRENLRKYGKEKAGRKEGKVILGKGDRQLFGSTIIKVTQDGNAVRVEYEPDAIGARITLNNGEIIPDAGIVIVVGGSPKISGYSKRLEYKQWKIDLKWFPGTRSIEIKTGKEIILVS